MPRLFITAPFKSRFQVNLENSLYTIAVFVMIVSGISRPNERNLWD